jgi:hypothetical protein
VAGDFESAVEKYSCLRIKPDKNKYTRLWTLTPTR